MCEDLFILARTALSTRKCILRFAEHFCYAVLRMITIGTRKNKNLNPALQQRLQAISLYD